MMLNISIERRLCLILSVIVLAACGTSDDDVTWEYTIPEGYVGWLAIQYECAGGKPLDRKGSVIRVTFGEDGLFCTTDSSFPWSGQSTAQSMSGFQIPVYGQPAGKTGYGICCQQAFSAARGAGPAPQIVLTLDLMWAGNMENGYPPFPINAIEEDRLAGKLVPVDW